ncbi:alpha-glucuronidase family glycosyl hydrolase [Halalkalibaculum sp. DA3122]|uniref:alpha-glucuronidase family glycosyl hydrolase n=1 Tax=Halalkalibaculum sp. DA3122 TaxID=3373607 RepID=UPI003754354E
MIRNMKRHLLFLVVFLVGLGAQQVMADDGYRLWLRYDQISDNARLQQYRLAFQEVVLAGDSETSRVTGREIQKGLSGLLGKEIPVKSELSGNRSLIIGTPSDSEIISSLNLDKKLTSVGDEGFLIEQHRVQGNDHVVIAANTDVGALYGTFHLLRLMKTHEEVQHISIASAPKIQHRVLNHWDNLDRTVERGYAGLSLWEWKTLPNYEDPRYTDYARANASLGINGTVINNVNADPRMLTEQYIKKAAKLADIFRPYGIKIYFSANFFAPSRVGGLENSDPLNPDVQQWWKDKADQIYKHIPDFGGFLVKANSEGQPGPQNYGRSHAEGANVLAEAVAPHGGIVMWRAFVYSPEQEDRFREGYDEFVPLDGQFADNVILQVKNGPIDFQPREPFHPLFGALPETNTMLELQITQEYFGFSLHLAYMGPLYKEALSADTYAKGEGSTVARVIDGEVFDYEHTGIAGVANTGRDRNWTGHPFGQSNWYLFGRLAWDHTQTAEGLADEWIRMTFTHDPDFVEPVKEMMMMSREAGVRYRNPLGLTHLYAQGHHYGPAPWTSDLPRPDWTAVYYHRADEEGIGFDRTESGSNAIEQYAPEVREQFDEMGDTPLEYLLWFHHVPWDYQLSTGRTLWQELVHRYYQGVEDVQEMREKWASVEGLIDKERYRHVEALLEIQEEAALWWRNACVLYFQQFAGEPIPEEYEKPEHSLEYYKELEKTHHIARF